MFKIVFTDLQMIDSGLYTCTASSESGETSWSATLTVEKNPGAHLHRSPDPTTFPMSPGVPQLFNASHSSLTVIWEPPDTGSEYFILPLIGYTLEYFSSDLQTGWVIAAHRVESNIHVVSLLNYVMIMSD